MEDDSDIPGVEDQAVEFDLLDELDQEDERAIAEAEADIAAGRVISNEAVMRWVRSWGTENELPPPECGE
ncbi:CopG family transcriptional regulator [Caulobacter mirabilis]|uniref:CopG family transcriptional regulator n=1 Tax=Caulobacter mirabilis TaxID=69666 RepID=UPI001FE4751D|nr:CopG family transcriptional regulator [Caulobacter mirabilis]